MKTLQLFVVILVSLVVFSCQKELSPEEIIASIPTVTTTTATSVTNTSAATGGNITDDGGAAITVRGVCWSTSPNPVLSGSHTSDGIGSGVFASNLTGLTANTIYYVRAYATNSVGTAYGNEISFTSTNASTALPTVSTASTSGITMTTAASGGNVTNDGGAAVTVRGVCWSTTANPTVALSTKTTDGSGPGVFTSNITGLTANTIYHVRAYATNSVGTSYGGDSVFTTASAPTIPVITTTAISAITNTTASSGGTISNDGGSPVTVRGVCWSTAANPTIALSTKTTDGTGIGTFTSAITGLTASTTYHVRAYATNSVGTAYGNDISFTTTGSSTPDVYVSGYEFGGAEFVAKTWKNGVPTALTNGAFDASANSIFVSGSDVYATGWEYNGTSNQPKLWKNGTATTLANACGGDGWSVFVSGTDVYVAGNRGTCVPNPRATVWKNNTATDLSNGSLLADTRAVYVSGTDVYVAGWEEVNSTTVIAKLWKNGIATDLNSGSVAFVHALFVAGSDVYVGGQESNAPNYVAKIWKNGVATTLTNGTNDACVISVFVSGADVYAAGYEHNGSKNVAKLWKNGIAQSLTNGADDAYANAVYVFGTDVYVCGSDGNVAKIWKNGIATSLTNGLNVADATSIFIK